MADFELIPTPDPVEFAIRIKVENKSIPEGLQLMVSSGSTPLVLYTEYKDFSWAKSAIRINEFGSYVYTYASAADDRHTYFHFAVPRTQTERDTPFETYWTSRVYPWPAVLQDLYFVKSDTFVNSVNNGASAVTTPRYFKRDVYRPSVSVNSRIRVEQYISERPWPGNALRHRQPIPTEVNFSFVGLSANYPKCLHPRIEVPELVPSYQLVEGAGVINPARVRAPSKQIFPATNFTDWQPFVINDSVEPTSGLWLREKATIFPPSRIESIESAD